MGSAHSTNGTCFSYVKGRTSSWRNRKFVPLKEESRSLVLTESDFNQQNFQELLRRHQDISHVRVGVDEGEWWLATDKDLEQLKAFHQLTSVDLSGCTGITRRGLEYISHNPGQIRTLILTDCPKITDKFFDHIVHFCQLERLDVRGCYWITDHGVEALPALKHLRHLDISLCATELAMNACASGGCSTITDRSMCTLARMTQLESLHLEGCLAVTEQGLIRLVTLRNLTFLNVASTSLRDTGLKLVRHLPELRSLDVSNCYLSESQALGQLTAATQLTHLNVSMVPGVTDKFIQGITDHLKLQHLDISGCEQLSDSCLDEINTLSSLTYLNANACPGSPRIIYSGAEGAVGMCGAALSRLSSLTRLRALHVNEAVDIDCTDVLPLIALEQLEIGAQSADDEALSKLSALKHLTDLTLHLSGSGSSHCTHIVGIRVHLLKHNDVEEISSE